MFMCESEVHEIDPPPPSSGISQNPGQYPGQTSGQYPIQKPGQYPIQKPGQYPGQTTGQYPIQKPGQYPGQKPSQTSGQYPIHKPGKYPGQHPGQNLGQKPVPGLNDARCTPESKAQIDRVNRLRDWKHQLECDPKLVWLAWRHANDQIQHLSRGGNFKTCILHSWNIEQPCCFYRDHSNNECMWDVFTRLAGYQLAESLAASSVYEISVGPLSKHANSTIQILTFEDAVQSFENSPKHKPVLE